MSYGVSIKSKTDSIMIDNANLLIEKVASGYQRPMYQKISTSRIQFVNGHVINYPAGCTRNNTLVFLRPHARFESLTSRLLLNERFHLGLALHTGGFSIMAPREGDTRNGPDSATTFGKELGTHSSGTGLGEGKATCYYEVWKILDDSSSASTSYGLVLKNSSNKVIFDSNKENFKVEGFAYDDVKIVWTTANPPQISSYANGAAIPFKNKNLKAQLQYLALANGTCHDTSIVESGPSGYDGLTENWNKQSRHCFRSFIEFNYRDEEDALYRESNVQLTTRLAETHPVGADQLTGWDTRVAKNIGHKSLLILGREI